MTQLPDPTVDLDWSGYVGSIQEHFRAQAEAHPERTCVVETKSSTTPERSFTYRQIYEASNTLAWYLHKAGVTNGDVVMIWAHRSVDLVVALMGILVRVPAVHIPAIGSCLLTWAAHLRLPVRP
jgi:L-aminoadipate-semialdehyde dehydrogenase